MSMNEKEEKEFIRVYWLQYKLLEKRMIELSDYVAVTPQNYATFSSHFFKYINSASEIAG